MRDVSLLARRAVFAAPKSIYHAAMTWVIYSFSVVRHREAGVLRVVHRLRRRRKRRVADDGETVDTYLHSCYLLTYLPTYILLFFWYLHIYRCLVISNVVNYSIH